MDLQRYFDVSQTNDVDAFKRALVTFACEMGFPLVTASLVIDKPGRRQAPVFVTVDNMPQAFIESSRDHSAMLRDPVNKRLKALSVPFIYDRALYVAEGAGDLWEEQARFGYRTGVAVALHLPDCKHFLLGFDREDPLPRQSATLGRLMADLQLLAVHAQSAAVKLLGDEADEPPAPSLTPREHEVLRWTMDGKSAASTGAILGLSDATVNFHVRNLCNKFGVASKHQATLKAIRLGLL